MVLFQEIKSVKCLIVGCHNILQLEVRYFVFNHLCANYWLTYCKIKNLMCVCGQC